MANKAALIRPSRDADVATIAAIYGHHVLHGLASFEEVPPEPGEIARRRAELVARGLPYLVAEEGRRVVGYAYAGLYRPRSAYRFTLEDSIYIDPERTGRGIGGLLLTELLERAAALGYRQMLAVIGGSDNLPSIRLHQRLGFNRVGMLPAIGFKFGGWVDTVLMQRALGAGAATMPP
jgi:L-amino acid N-acyltransferase YncA